MIYTLNLLQAFLVVSVLILISFLIGTKLRNRFLPVDAKQSTFYIEGILLSLLISFTFSVAAGKYDKRRSVFNDEINAISTAMHRIKLYPDSVYLDLRPLMANYLETRIAYYTAGTDQDSIDMILVNGQNLADQIFDIIDRAAANSAILAATQQMVPAANQMFDLASSREIYRLSRVPVSVINLLVVLSMVVSFLNGLNQEKNRPNWISASGYTLLIAMSFTLILDLGENRSGYINLDTEQKTMIALRNQF